MLNRIFEADHCRCVCATGLILPEYLLPYISDFWLRSLHNGFLQFWQLLFPGAVIIPLFWWSCVVALRLFIILWVIRNVWRSFHPRCRPVIFLVKTLGIGIGLICQPWVGLFAFADYWSLYSLIFSLVLSLLGWKLLLRKHKDIVWLFNRSILA